MKKLVRKKTFNNINIYLISIFFLAISTGVGYAMLSSNLNIVGTTTVKKATWDVHFENLVQTQGSIAATSSSIDSTSTIVNFDISLNNPGDYYEFTVDVVNDGTLDAMISSVVNTGLTPEQQKFLIYEVAYSDKTEIAEKQLLKAGTKESIKVTIKYRDDIAESDALQDDENLQVQLNVLYVQADDTSIAIRNN